MKKIKAMAAIATFISTLVLAQTTGAAEKAVIFGKVNDPRNQTVLRGVSVTVEGTDARTSTDRSGNYQVALPAGEYDVIFDYMGYTPVKRTVTVSAGSRTELNVSLKDGAIELGTVVVTGRRVGQAKSLNRQKTALNVKNVVSSDAFGRFPDQNAAEALNRLPGVSVERDQGEGRFVVIRGINPDLNSFAVDGMPLASPDADDRSVLLDVVPSDTLEALVVTKTVTPDQPGDALGGYVNIETPSAFDYEKRFARLSVQGNYSDLSEDWGGRVNGVFGSTFGMDDRLGFVVSGSFDRRDMASDNQEADPWELVNRDDGPSFWAPTELQYREYDLERERSGLTARLEYQPGVDHRFFLRTNYSEYEDHEIRHRLVVEPDDIATGLVQLDADSGVLVDAETVREMKDRTETLKNFAFSAGGKNRFGMISLDYAAGYSYAEEDTPDDLEAVFELDDVTEYLYTRANGYHPRILYSAGRDPRNAANYEFDGVEDANQIVEEDNTTLLANLKIDMESDWLSAIKAGFRINLKEKTSDVEVFESYDNPAAIDTLAGISGTGRQEYNNYPYVSDNFKDYFDQNTAAFDMERNDFDSIIEDYELNEDVYAFYIMGNFTFDKLDAVAGVRVEMTEFDTTGTSADENDLANAVTRTIENDCTNTLPSIHLRYAASKDFILRGAWTNTIARPTYEQNRFAEEIDGTDISVGNPELDPYEAMNFDLSGEYYFGDFSVFGLGVFYKDIENFIFPQVIQNGSRLGGDLETFNNGEEGEIYGMEVSCNVLLNMLPAPMDGFSIYSNLTLTSSEMTILPSDGEPGRDTPFLKQSDVIGNVALSYEKHGFFFRVAGTYRSEYLDELGEMESEDRYMDDHFQVDISSSYTIHDHFTVFANFINITDEPLRAYFDESDRLSQYEKYGMSAAVGVKYDF